MGLKSQDICSDFSPGSGSTQLKSCAALKNSSFTISTLSVPKRFKRNSKNYCGKNKFKNNLINCDKLESKKFKKMVAPTRSSSVNTIRRSRQSPPVAIATQVLNPSSLKGQRLSKRFCRTDNEEEGLFTYKRRNGAWKKFCYYGVSITATILILMAFILAVGYFQSEKNKKTIVSRSVKLIQERRPLSYEYTSTPPPSLELEPTDSQEFVPTTHSSFFLSSREIGGFDSKEQVFSSPQHSSHMSMGKSEKDDDRNENERDVDYNSNYDLEDFDIGVNSKVEENREEISDNFSKDQESSFNNIKGNVSSSDVNEKENENNDSTFNVKLDDNDKSAQENIDYNESNDSWKSSIVPDDDDTISKTITENKDARFPSEVKVKPPQDFVFSIEIPIYKPNKTISSDENEEENQIQDKRIVSNINHNDEISDTSETNNGIREKVHELPLIITEVTSLTKEQKNKSLIDDIIDTSSDNNADKGYLRDNKPTVSDHDKYHESVLHTVLFKAEDEDDDNYNSNDYYDRGNKFSAKLRGTTFTLPNKVSHSMTESVVNEPLRKGSETITLSSNRSRARSRKIKVLKNDTVLNFKARFTPPGRNLSNASPNQSENNDDTRKPSSLRLTKDKKGKANFDTGDFGNIKDFVMEPYSNQRHLQATSARQNIEQEIKEGSSIPEETLDLETPRSLSSSSSYSSNFEAFLRNILSSAGKLNLHTAAEPNRKYSQISQGSGLVSNVNQFLPPISQPLAASSYTGLGLDSSQLSKRTYNSQYEIEYPPPFSSTTSSHTENYFDHLLGLNPALGSIGSSSVVGATAHANLNNFYPQYYPTPTQPSTSFDISSSGTDEIPKLAPGVVPIDLASSYIPSISFTNSHFSNTNERNPYSGTNQFNQISPTENPYPFTFNNAGGDIGTLTTITGQPPTYNTISQGMHLLNLISGVVPSTYYHDQVYNPLSSTSQTLTHALTSEPLNPNPSVSTHPYFGNLSPVQTNNWDKASHTGTDSEGKTSDQSLPHAFFPYQQTSSSSRYEDDRFENDPETYSGHQPHPRFQPHSKESFEESDQQPAASSFSNNILTFVKDPRIKSNKTSVNMAGLHSPGKEFMAVVTKPMKMNSKPAILPQPNYSLKPESKPTSYSFEILTTGRNQIDQSAKSGNMIDDTLNGLGADIIHSSLDNFVSGSKSKKKAGASLENALEMEEKLSALDETSSQRGGKFLKSKGTRFANNNNKSYKHTEGTPLQSKIPFSDDNQIYNTKMNKYRETGLQPGFYKV